MKKIILFAGILVVATATLLTVSCSKPTLDTNTQTAVDNNLCENEFMRILPAVNVLMVGHYGKGIHKAETVKYPTVTLITDTTKTPWPRVIQIDYGTGVADSSDGKTRAGIIYASFNNYWNITGTTCTITFNSYLVNNVSYNSTITALRTKPTEFKVSVVNGVCTSSSWKIAFAATRTFDWVGGYNDSVPSHSQYSITGTANGTDRNTTNYTLTITSALTKRLNCASVCGGSEQIIPAGLADRTVSFGNGTCTGSASVTINGQSFTVSE